MSKNTIKKNRVLGARGIGVNNSNLNAGFDGRPKVLSDGTLFGSDVCTKFLDRDFWKNYGEKVLIKKKIKEAKDGTLYACTLDEILADSLDKNENAIMQILNDFVDVQNFGATIAVSKISIGATGVCQYSQSINKLTNTSVITQDILSPFGTANNKKNKAKSDKGEEVNNTTATNIGKHIFVDKALYVQSFSVNPKNLNNLSDSFSAEGFAGYKEESYQLFKKAVLCSASLYNTRTKMGCYDEFSIFINLKEDSIFNVPDIGRFIEVIENEDSTVTIDFKKLSFLNDVADVDSIEIFYNSLTSNIEHDFNNVEVKDLLACY